MNFSVEIHSKLISIACPFDGCNYSTTKSHNSRMHNKKMESKLTNVNRGEIFKSDVDVELDNNEHVDDDFKFKIFVAKELKHLESKRKINKCVISEIVDFCHQHCFCRFKKI